MSRVDKHVGAIEEDIAGTSCNASCSCSWSGPIQDSAMQAVKDLKDHYSASMSRFVEDNL